MQSRPSNKQSIDEQFRPTATLQCFPLKAHNLPLTTRTGSIRIMQVSAWFAHWRLFDVIRTHPIAGGNMCTPRFSASRQQTLPRLSNSPHSSVKSVQSGSQNSPPQAISPAMVSPNSAIESTLSDISPASMHIRSLPNSPAMYTVPFGTPLPNIDITTANSPKNGVAMVSGFPFPTHSVPRGGPVRRSTRPKPGRDSPTGKMVKKENEDTDDSQNSVDGKGEEEVLESNAMSFSTPQYVPPPSCLTLLTRPAASPANVILSRI